ncbi:MAG: hypothetical protein JO325_23935 [Solirubrobacterales bacterium]|nr:hypothetical protein [Solirubrobacterales bacterium]
MSHRKEERRAGRRSALVVLALAVFGGLLVQSAVAATPTPESSTLCSGTLNRAKPTPDDPNLVNYKFNCNGGITAYTLIVFRKANDAGTIDDFNTNPVVVDTTGNPVSKTALACAGEIPGFGINCNAGAGGSVPSPDWSEGSFDLTEPYCANLPPGSKPTAKPDPAAVVELVVSDTTGAEDGPFRLRLAGKCPPPKLATKTKKTTSKKTASKRV